MEDQAPYPALGLRMPSAGGRGCPQPAVVEAHDLLGKDRRRHLPCEMGFGNRYAFCVAETETIENPLMSQSIHLDLELPDDLALFKLPAGVKERLTSLLDKQDSGQALTDQEKREAELVVLADTLTYLGLKTKAAA